MIARAAMAPNVVRKHRQPVLRYAFRIIRDRTAAEDVASNWMRDHARTRSHQPIENPRFIDRTVRIDEWLMFQSELNELLAAAEQLPDRQRRIVRQQAIRSTLCRAYSKLRVQLPAPPT